ncbi:MAG: 5-oxoprolinase subunit B family protein [Ilumatobacteraceae bacterium]
MTETGRRLLPYGPSGWLVEVDDGDVLGYAAAARGGPDVDEAVPAATTVLVRLRHGADRVAVADWLGGLAPVDAGSFDAANAVELDVVYDGADLHHVASATGLTVDEVVDLHAAGRYTCAFCGFAPGFGYLAGLDERLNLPRRSTPRTNVPLGAVAIAAGYSAVYPSPSPGGWHLLGRTDADVWDPRRPQPALLRPGTTVRFTPR